MRNRFLLALILLILPAVAFASSWPTLQEQLARDSVPAGSELAKLIAAHQDFQILRPEEAEDDIGAPPWLRVWWRRLHPEAEYPADDPTGGYPLALREIHQWMVLHPDLQPGGIEPGSPIEKVGDKAATVGQDISITGAQPNLRAESDIRVNYWDPSRIVAAANSFGFIPSMPVYYSSNGGATWSATNLPTNREDSSQSDPAVDWTSDGTAWVTTIGIDGVRGILRMRAYRSTDGVNWTHDAVFSGSQTFADKQMIWTDHSNRSKYKDHIYAIWHNGRPVYMSRRTPGPNGAWSTPVQVSGRETKGTGIGADVKTNAAGHVFAFWPDTGSRKIYLTRSLDGGASYTKPVTVAKTFGVFTAGIPAQNARRVLIYVTGGAFQKGKKSLVYAAWMDLSGAPGCRGPFDDPRNNAGAACKTRIWFSRSTNGGLRWSKPRMINNQTGLNDQFNPWMVVDEATGALGIIYYDTVGESRTRTNLWYQSSFDEGVTWRAPIKVTSAASEAVGTSGGNFQYGDYNGLSGIAGTFFPIWTDRRTPGAQQIWTAPIRDTKSGVCKTTDLFTDSVGKGVASLAVPAGATEARLSFWHRRRFPGQENGGTLKLSVDGGVPVPVPPAAILAGAGMEDEFRFKGIDRQPVNTVVDLDAVCDLATGGAGGCAGRSLRLVFSAGDDASRDGDVWFLDEVAVTACTP